VTPVAADTFNLCERVLRIAHYLAREGLVPASRFLFVLLLFSALPGEVSRLWYPGECEVISGTCLGPLLSRQHRDNHVTLQNAVGMRSGGRGITGSISTVNLKIRELSTLRFPSSIRLHVIAGIAVRV
jgi:hypothetical protein